MKKLEDFLKNTVSLEGRGMDKTMNNHNERGKNEKFLKNYLENDPQSAKHAFFATGMSREQVAKPSRQKSMWQIMKKISKYFLRLEGPLASKSQGLPQNSLSKTCDWSFHLRISHQTESRKY